MYGTTKHLGGCLAASTRNRHDCSCENKIRRWGGYINAALLAVVAGGIALAAYDRYYHPREVFGAAIIAPAFLGGVLNWWQHHELEHGHKNELVRYVRVLIIGVLIFVMQMSVGVWAGSLALVSDAWHVLVDNGAAIVSIIVTCLVPERIDRAHMTHGLMSAHVLSDLFQSGAVIVAGAWIFYTGEYLVDSLTSFAIAAVLFGWAVWITCQCYLGTYDEYR